jgi:RNA-directed DNA polymerase
MVLDESRNAHQAIRKARQYMNEGYTWVVDIDLEKYFDTVNHDKLMLPVAREVKEKKSIETNTSIP